MSLDLKLGPEHLGYMRLGSEVADLASDIDLNAQKTVLQWSKMSRFFNKKLAECVELDKQWSKFFTRNQVIMFMPLAKSATLLPKRM